MPTPFAAILALRTVLVLVTIIFAITIMLALSCPRLRSLAKSSYNLECRKVESLAYIFAADSMGLSSFNFLWWAPNDASFLQ